MYIFKHDFGICYLYRNKTNNMTLHEKVNIENNSNIEFYEENQNINNNDNINNSNASINFEKKKEMKITLPPHNDYFLDLRSKSLLWKVNPVFTYTIEKVPNVEEDINNNSNKSQSDNKSDSNDDNKDNGNENIFCDSRERSRSLKTNSPTSIRIDNYEENEKKDEVDHEIETEQINESYEKAGDSSDVSSSSDDKSEDSN